MGRIRPIDRTKRRHRAGDPDHAVERLIESDPTAVTYDSTRRTSDQRVKPTRALPDPSYPSVTSEWRVMATLSAVTENG